MPLRSTQSDDADRIVMPRKPSELLIDSPSFGHHRRVDDQVNILRDKKSCCSPVFDFLFDLAAGGGESISSEFAVPDLRFLLGVGIAAGVVLGRRKDGLSQEKLSMGV